MSQETIEPQHSLEAQPGETNTPEGTDVPNPIEETPVVSASKGLRGAGLRYTDDDGVPEWAVGKTADEILEITKTLHATMTSSQPTTQTQAPTPVTPQQQPVQQPSLSGDMLYSNPDGFVQGVQDYTKATVSESIRQASEPLLAPLATMARSEAQRNPEYADIWKRYAPEIDAVMQTVPLNNRGNVDLWNQAAEMVAGKHYRELAKAEAERLVASGDSGMIPTGGVPSTSASATLSPIDALFAKNDPAIQKFKDAGISATQVKGFASSMGHTEAAYAEMLTSNKNIRVG